MVPSDCPTCRWAVLEGGLKGTIIDCPKHGVLKEVKNYVGSVQEQMESHDKAFYPIIWTPVKIPLTNPDKDTNLQELTMDGQVAKEGIKKDEGKPRFELLDYQVLEAVSRILTKGAEKYDDRNWENGINYGRVYGAALRHLSAFWTVYLNKSDGINHADGNESHLDHAITELMFLSAYEKRGMKQFDDRPGKSISDIPTDLHDLRQG